MQIKVNVINEMRKIRSTAYADQMSWVDELIQNAQRANASRVDIEVKSDYFRIEDNGEGCDNPEALFEKSTTGWGSGVDSQNPFGEGFFATIIVADKIMVRSNGFEALMDIEEMFEKETVDCIDIKGSSRRSGFVAKLQELDQEIYSIYRVERRIKKLAKYMKMNIYLNGEKLDSIDFQTVQYRNKDKFGDFAILLDNEYYEGWIAPTDGWSDDLNLYAQRRYVKEIFKSDIAGVIHAKSQKLDLRSPDRKDVINNEKYTDFREAMDQDIKRMWIELVRNGSDQDIDQFAGTIEEWLEIDDYKQYLRFISTSSNRLESILKELRELKGDNTSDEDREKLNDIMEDMGYTSTGKEPDTEIDPDYIEPEEVTERPEKVGNKLDDLKDVGFYVAHAELTDFQKKLSLADYYGIPTVIAKNSLEVNVLDTFLPHISDLSKTSKISASIKEAGPETELEQRAMFIFRAISNMLGIPEDTFKVGNVTANKVQIVGEVEKVEEMDTVLAIEYEGQIYIDRNSLDLEVLNASEQENLTNSDRQFICNNLEVIAHELSHVIYDASDNTKEHEEGQRKITHRILKGLY